MDYFKVILIVIFVWTVTRVRCEVPDDWCVENGLLLAKGVSWQLQGQCIQATCWGNNVTTALGCASTNVDETIGWMLSDEDLTKPYPDCCPQPVPTSKINTQQPPQCEKNGLIYLIGERTADIFGWCGVDVCIVDNTWSPISCWVISAPEGWTSIPEDLSKPYPECCAQAVPLVLEETGGDDSQNIQTEVGDNTQTEIPSSNQLESVHEDSLENQTQSLELESTSDTFEKSNLELSGLSKAVDEVNLQVPSLRGNLNTEAQEDPEYWSRTEYSETQRVRSTFPNDQAGLKRKFSDQSLNTITEVNNNKSPEKGHLHENNVFIEEKPQEYKSSEDNVVKDENDPGISSGPYRWMDIFK